MGFGSKGPSGSTTSTSTTTPWGPQQPYLQDIFTNAQSLYQNNAPQYFPGTTYAAPNDVQQNALNAITSLGMSYSPITASAQNTANSFLSGQMSAYDPAIQPLTSFATNNITPTGLPSLDQFLWGSPAADASAPYASALDQIIGGHQDTSVPGASALSPFLSGTRDTSVPGAASLSPFLTGKQDTSVPYADALTPYTSGARMAAGNPYTTQLANSIFAQVTPQIQSQFIAGGALSSPEAARATAAGQTSALAAPLFQQYQNEAANQLAAQQQGAQQALQARQNAAANTLQAQNIFGTQGLTARQNEAANTLGAANMTGALGLQARQAAMANLLGAQNQLGSQTLQARQNAATNTLAAQNQSADQGLRALGLGLQGSTALQNAYGQNTQQMLAAMGLAPTIQQMPYADLAQAFGAGSFSQNASQQAINDAVQRWNYQQTLPFQQLNQYIGQVTGNYGGTTTATQPYFNNQGSNLLGGALGGAQLGSSILPGLLGTTAAESGGIGSLLGLGLLGFGSDRRMKEDIRQIDVLDNGLPLYVYRYIGDPMMWIGVMADEVEKVRPEAVITGLGGFAMVDYEMAVH